MPKLDMSKQTKTVVLSGVKEGSIIWLWVNGVMVERIQHTHKSLREIDIPSIYDDEIIVKITHLSYQDVELKIERDRFAAGYMGFSIDQKKNKSSYGSMWIK